MECIDYKLGSSKKRIATNFFLNILKRERNETGKRRIKKKLGHKMQFYGLELSDTKCNFMALSFIISTHKG
jgi:hypothetical protein